MKQVTQTELLHPASAPLLLKPNRRGTYAHINKHSSQYPAQLSLPFSQHGLEELRQGVESEAAVGTG